MPDQVNPTERLPRAVVELLGTGQPDCPRCHGDGVLVVTSLSGPAFRACQCVARRRPVVRRRERAA